MMLLLLMLLTLELLALELLMLKLLALYVLTLHAHLPGRIGPIQLLQTLLLQMLGALLREVMRRPLRQGL
ncbi:hypothetical protein GCM10027217_41160 [Pseudomaricurvus hydrocarbonicus]